MTPEELAAIREHHRYVSEAVPEIKMSMNGLQAHADRYALLAEVDRLLAANQQLRADLERVIATLRVATPDNTLVVGGQEVVSLTDPPDV